jgi:4-hydroxybenzoate polyprenyltransferase
MLIFLPLIFAGKAFNLDLMVKAIVGFVSFSFVASVVYIINDIHDLEHDKRHDYKKKRPLAAGEISIKHASFLAFVLTVVAAVLNGLINNSPLTWTVLFTYAFINLAYSLGLKNIPLVDVSIIVAGFILRVTFGGAVVDVPISRWMYLTIMAMSFYLALGKRRNEIQKSGYSARAVLKYYTEDFLDKMMYVSLGLTIVFYSLWCVAPSDATTKSENLIWTVPLVLLICMKYSMNIEGDSSGDPAEVLLGDKTLLLLVFAYGILLIAVFYGLKILTILGF